MSPETLARELEEYLAVEGQSSVLEDGEKLFDFAETRYSVSGEPGKCLLHLWSPERNAVRRVIDLERRGAQLRLTIQRFGKGKPSTLEIVPNGTTRSPSAQRLERSRYKRLLEKMLRVEFPNWSLELANTEQLEHSFSPVYTRGLLRRGRSSICVFGVGEAESQSSVDGALTFALLWFHHCREREAGRTAVEALRLYLPPRRIEVASARMHCLTRAAGRMEIYEFNQRDSTAVCADSLDQGNIATRLVRCPDAHAVRERFASAHARVKSAVPECDAVPLSSTELSFRLHGLEFARVRITGDVGGLSRTEEIVFGSGPHETVLGPESEGLFQDLMLRLRATRRPDGDRNHPLWRMQPEGWLESRIAREITAIDSQLDPAFVYEQVPAFAASDRGMIDLLSLTREGRLAVLELKADEDIHLPLQGLDYWSRVKWHHSREDFQRFGYFVISDGERRALSPQAPLLMLVAPALHIHPATEILLRYLAPDIPWTLIAVDERWRHELKVVFRKRPEAQIQHASAP